MPKTACYCRVSTENQIENYSIDEQKERLKAFCKARGWDDPEMFVDAGFSGGSLNRPALRSLIEQVKSGKIGIVAVYKLDRLSRSQKDTLYLIEDVFNKYNVGFVSVCENFDTCTPFGKAMVGILSVFAQLEKDQITERFTMGRIARAKSGLFHGGGNAPIGYDYINGELVVNEYRAAQVKEIFELFRQGKSIRAIVNVMNEKYNDWSSTSVYQTLKNSVYIGKVKFNGEEYDGKHEPVITPETFYETQRLLSERSDKIPDKQKTPFRAGFMLSGLLVCGNCGARYHGNHGYYKCYSRAKSDKKYIIDPDCRNPNMRIEVLDEIIRGEIAKASIDPQQVLTKAADPTDSDDNISAIRSELEKNKQQTQKLLDLYQIDGIPIESVSERLRKLEDEKIKLKERFSRLPKTTTNRRAEWLNTLKLWQENLNGTDTDQQRIYVASLIRKIVINHDETVSIEWRV